ncbi:MAG: hypothetical protein JNL28_03170 [Planctomycetes bacterium]|nr:hypothetical protein [Planctomycetota bacterium]
MPDEPPPAVPPSTPPPQHVVPGATLPPLQRAVVPPPEPLRADEVNAALSNPLRAIDVVLASPRRVAQNLETSTSLVTLAVVFLATAALFALPYGFVLGTDAWWRVTAFYLGSTLLCLPSLFVFSAYLGFGAKLTSTTVLALTIPASAALFTAGFAPILWFLQITFDSEAKQIGWRDVSNVLLWISLGAGVVQLWRSMRKPPVDTAGAFLFVLMWMAWHAVFFYVLARMGHVLGLVR